MDIITGITIVSGVIVVSATGLGILKIIKGDDKTWTKPVNELENKIQNCGTASGKRLNSIENRLTKVETKVEGISDLKIDIRNLDTKVDKLHGTILEWISKFTNKE